MATSDNPPTSLPVRQPQPPFPARAPLTTLPVRDTGVEAALFYEKDARPEAGAATGMKLAAGAFTALVALVLLMADC